MSCYVFVHGAWHTGELLEATAKPMRAAGHEVHLELCLDRCAHCDRGEIVGRVGDDWVAQEPKLWRQLC